MIRRDRIRRAVSLASIVTKAARMGTRPCSRGGRVRVDWTCSQNLCAYFLRAHYSPMERLCLASAAFLSLDPDARLELIEAAERGQQADEWPFPGVDPEMLRRVWREHRPPPLTSVEKRRAAAITFDDTPRAILAAAWAGASDRDRRDLVNRVTGWDAA